MTTTKQTTRYFDIAVNFTDSMFDGEYHGSKHHESDMKQVIQRAKLFNVQKILVTGSSIKESARTIKICESYKDYLFSTVGVHPCSVQDDFYQNDKLVEDYEAKLDELYDMAIRGKNEGTVKAFGEIGLDYARLHYTPADNQKLFFANQLDIATKLDLPLFLHMRDACDDFIDIIKPYLPNTPTINSQKKLTKHGVIHSFTGNLDELHKLLDLGFYIGVNGCSLKSQENLDVAKEIPLNRLMIETDAPWCEIKRTHAGYKYITPYPNEYYPEIIKQIDPIETKITEKLEDMSLQKPKKKVQQGKKDQGPKLDDFLPFPVIKNQNFNKHYEKNITSGEELIGPLAHPLIKSRNEPVLVGFVAEILANLKNVDSTTIIEHSYRNSCLLFEVDL